MRRKEQFGPVGAGEEQCGEGPLVAARRVAPVLTLDGIDQ